ncbi:MAG: putative Ig domain-containing protein [Prosthecobacter sp.]|nr:putative Ig domain-containing protein [Prosthecobacter sp.]
MRLLFFILILALGMPAVSAAAIEITGQPAGKILPVGGTLSLTTAAQGAEGLRYQWKKNNANVAGAGVTGATTGELTITGLSLTHAGVYKCVVTGTVGGKLVTATTAEAQVAVVDTAPKNLTVAAGVKTTLTSLATGNGLGYQWYSGIDPIPGATAKTLVFASPQVADSATYLCRITTAAGSVDGGATTITVYDKAPLIILPAGEGEGDAMPAAIVSGTYAFQVPFDPAPDRTPISFGATGLPPGLTINTKSGLVSGKPTAAKAVPYAITLTATNAKGKASAAVNLTVSPLNSNLVGSFLAVISRFTDLNEGLGGRMTLLTTATGAFTGKLILGGNTYPFSGKLDANVGTPLLALATVAVTRAKKTPLTLTFTLDADTNCISIAQITDGAATLEFSGWRNIWTRLAPASALAGYYTFGLTIPDSALTDDTIPQGAGYGSFKLAPATGILTAAGKLADGTAYTTATFAGPNGEVPLYQTLYTATNRGSLLGILFIGAADPVTDNTVYGSLSWLYPGSTATSARTYAAGFGPIDLTVEGAIYLPPTAPQVILSLTESTTINGALTFIGPFSDIPAPAPDLGVVIGAKSKLTLPTGISNPRKTTLTASAALGTFSGGFTLTDADLLAPGKTVTRRGTYNGLIVRDPATGLQTGKGFFLLSERPAVAGDTPANTMILSGKVVLAPSEE